MVMQHMLFSYSPSVMFMHKSFFYRKSIPGLSPMGGPSFSGTVQKSVSASFWQELYVRTYLTFDRSFRKRLNFGSTTVFHTFSAERRSSSPPPFLTTILQSPSLPPTI